MICIHFIIDESDIETNLRHPRMLIGSDGIPELKGNPHPRLFGTMPRVLSRYVRERKVLSLEEAIKRMTQRLVPALRPGGSRAREGRLLRPTSCSSTRTR